MVRADIFYRFFGSFCFLKGSDNFKFFFGGKFFELNKLSFNTQDLSVIFLGRFSCVDKVFHIVLIKNFLFPERNRQLIFSPKIPYNLIAERSEANRKSLQIPRWCSGRESNSHAFWAHGPKPCLSASSSTRARAKPY